VTELAEPHAISLAAIVQHLQVLEQSGLVRSEKVGRVRTCRVEPAGSSVAERWNALLDALRAELRRAAE
jgi:DNA-binding transcriptional ArsR family regulator